MSLVVKQVECGGDRNFGYIIGCDKKRVCVIIDPSPDATSIINEVSKLDMKILFVLNTHGHGDHTSGNEMVLNSISSPLYKKLNHNEELNVGEETIRCLHTPGHTEDSVCFLTGENLLTGDTLFVGKIGGTWSDEDTVTECESLKELMKLPDSTIVLPGHNYGASPTSTIVEERESNPFCQRLDNLEEFMRLKKNWSQYKKQHGIQ